MRFCPDHWSALRHAIALRKLDALIAESGESSATNLISQMAEGKTTIDNFDPLMDAHNAILAKSMEYIKDRYQQNPLILMADEDDPAVTWPTCPVCALYWCHEEHNRICTKPGCDYPKEFDWEHEMIDGAADHMLAMWKEMQP